LAQIAADLRRQAPSLTGTYELSLAILFFDRLGEPADGSKIRSFARRLADGQTADGAWSYGCPMRAGPGVPGRPSVRPRMLPGGLAWSDHSNTQFAVLGLWVAQRHGFNARAALSRTAGHFRSIQNRDGGWGYRPDEKSSSLANTCSGLLALAARHGLHLQFSPDEPNIVGMKPDTDTAVAAGLDALCHLLYPQGSPRDARSRPHEPRFSHELYTLWSVERVATLYGLHTIGDQEWYPWMASKLVGTQLSDGSWRRSYPAPIDTAFALLILRRTNFLPDLTAALQGGLTARELERIGQSSPASKRQAPLSASSAVQDRGAGPVQGVAQSPSAGPPALGPDASGPRVLSGSIQSVAPGNAPSTTQPMPKLPKELPGQPPGP
jgi:hypothetical protein